MYSHYPHIPSRCINLLLFFFKDDAFRKGIADLAEGRYVQTVELYKPEGQSLGFKVVGLNKNSKLGIYIQEIHDNGIAARYVKHMLAFFWQSVNMFLFQKKP